MVSYYEVATPLEHLAVMGNSVLTPESCNCSMTGGNNPKNEKVGVNITSCVFMWGHLVDSLKIRL